MTASIDQSLESISEGLRRLGREPLLTALDAPLSFGEVAPALEDVGLAPSASVAALYEWHNGTKRDISLDDSQLFPGFYFPDFDEALTNYKVFCESPRWTRGWFPLFADGGGDFYVADFNSDAVPMRRFRIEYAECPVEYESLPDMLSTLAAAFDEGIYYVDDDGYLEIDRVAFSSLAARLNPRVAWWKD